MRRFAITLGSLAIASLTSATAFAQSVSVGGSISVGIPQIPSAPAPTVVYPQTRPTVVYTQPRYAQPAPHPHYARVREPFWGAPKVGLDLRLDGAAGFGAGPFRSVYGMGGAGVGLRYRAMPHLGFEAGIDLLGGRDYNDKKRFEVVGSGGAMVFFNPRSRAQVYLSGGIFVDHARATPEGFTTVSASQTHDHFGGYAGLGLEVFMTRSLAFHLDGRGMLRQKFGGSPGAEFTDAATGRSTNTSGGFVGSAGLAIYF